jgi:hypothetical protein
MRIPTLLSLLAAVALAVIAASAPAQESAWHASLDKGLEAAKKSGKPLFVVTVWPRGV